MYVQLTVRSMLKNEIKGWLGRKALNQKPLIDGTNAYLNLGCGSRIVPGYVNADYYRFKWWKQDTRNLQWQLDLRHPLN